MTQIVLFVLHKVTKSDFNVHRSQIRLVDPQRCVSCTTDERLCKVEQTGSLKVNYCV